LKHFFYKRWENDSRFRVIFNGVDSSEFSIQKDWSVRRALNIPDSTFVIGHTGRLDLKKNQKAILQLASHYAEKNADVVFVLCGKDTELLSEEISSLQLGNRFFVLGYRDDVPLVLRNFDAFYFPSYTEGQPNALIEALLSGLPVVTSNIEPIRETLPELLVNQMVGPDDIVGAIQKMDIIIEGEYHVKGIDISNWAIERYDSSVRFSEFETALFS
jgi:glycosyltransferase involved in cell wall biosynthesis